MFIKLVINLLLITSTQAIFAYIPKFSTISNKITRARASSPIKVVQDIIAKDQLTGVTYTVRETLYIKNGDEIKIKVEGKDLLAGQVKTSFIYKGQQKFSLNGNSVSTNKTPTQFYAPLIYSRTSGELKKHLLAKNIIPGSASQNSPTQLRNLSSYAKDTFTHLSRTNGGVSYAITKKLSSQNNVHPTIWVGTNNFQINKIRLSENGVINLLNYKEFNKKISHASEQVIHWQNYQFTINTISIKPISTSQAQMELNPSSLRSAGSVNNYKTDALETFYSVFR